MATIKDVAREAGVSVGTVSNVINNIAVKPGTKALVENAIKKLNYEPNVYARGFKMNRTNTVALILPTIWNPFFSELAYNIEKNLRNFGMKMLLCNSEDNQSSELEYITMAKQNKVDGIIAISYSDIDKYVSAQIPIISIDRYFSDDITYVSSDNLSGGRLAAEELVKAGCKSIAYIGRGSKINNATRNRKKGFIDYCKENDISCKVCDLLGSAGEFDSMLNEFLVDNFKNDIKIDGIFTITDEYAKKVINRLKEFNIKVLDDVQVIGYNGSKPSAKDIIEISTVRQPIELIAKESVNALIQIIDKKKVAKEIVLPVKFIKGYTTK